MQAEPHQFLALSLNQALAHSLPKPVFHQVHATATPHHYNSSEPRAQPLTTHPSQHTKITTNPNAQHTAIAPQVTQPLSLAPTWLPAGTVHEPPASVLHLPSSTAPDDALYCARYSHTVAPSTGPAPPVSLVLVTQAVTEEGPTMTAAARCEIVTTLTDAELRVTGVVQRWYVQQLATTCTAERDGSSVRFRRCTPAAGESPGGTATS